MVSHCTRSITKSLMSSYDLAQFRDFQRTRTGSTCEIHKVSHISSDKITWCRVVRRESSQHEQEHRAQVLDITWLRQDTSRNLIISTYSWNRTIVLVSVWFGNDITMSDESSGCTMWESKRGGLRRDRLVHIESWGQSTATLAILRTFWDSMYVVRDQGTIRNILEPTRERYLTELKLVNLKPWFLLRYACKQPGRDLLYVDIDMVFSLDLTLQYWKSWRAVRFQSSTRNRIYLSHRRSFVCAVSSSDVKNTIVRVRMGPSTIYNPHAPDDHLLDHDGVFDMWWRTILHIETLSKAHKRSHFESFYNVIWLSSIIRSYSRAQHAGKGLVVPQWSDDDGFWFCGISQ